MHIIVFSITPLFPAHDMGGGQKHLRTIAMHLADLGHSLTILCTRRADTAESFRWHERIEVKPILRFKQPFPAPYDTPAYNIANIIADVAEHLIGADRFYIHDGEFVFPYVYRDIPTVVSLRDNVYPETIQGAFHFEASTLIVISHYARDFFLNTVGCFFPELPDRMRVIRNSVDWARFKPTPPGRILEIVPVDPARDLIVLHPHRPEDSKGIRQTIEVVDRLVNQYGLTSVKACVPQWLGVAYDSGVSNFYARIEAEIGARGLRDHFVFHPWIPVDLLPEYYSMGGVTLALGSFVESFGNTVYESLGCGTPSVVARISSHRELLPEGYVDKVDYDDHDAAARRAAAILTERRRTPQRTLNYLYEHYQIDTQLNAYADAILNATTASPMQYRYTALHEGTRYALASWCYRSQYGIYHDYRADYFIGVEADALASLLDAHPDGFTAADAAVLGIANERVEAWRREGYVIERSDE